MDGALTNKRPRFGLSLLEVMISLGILAVAILALLSVFVGGLSLMQRSNELAAANNVAKSTLEAIKRDIQASGFSFVPSDSYTYDGRVPDSALNRGTSVFPPAPYPSTTVDGEKYTVMVEGATEGTRLKRLGVSIFWSDNPPLKLETVLHP